MMTKIDKSPVKGYALNFLKVGSYSYPNITRASDGAAVWLGGVRPYKGRKADAYEKFRKVAARCVSIEGVKTRDELSEKQVLSVRRLAGIFKPIGGGEWGI